MLKNFQNPLLKLGFLLEKKWVGGVFLCPCLAYSVPSHMTDDQQPEFEGGWLFALEPELQTGTCCIPFQTLFVPTECTQVTLLEDLGHCGSSPARCLSHMLGFPSVVCCLLCLSVSCEVLVSIKFHLCHALLEHFPTLDPCFK